MYVRRLFLCVVVHRNFRLIRTGKIWTDLRCIANPKIIIMQCLLFLPPALFLWMETIVYATIHHCTRIFFFLSRNSIQTMTGQAEKKSSIVRVKSQSYEIPCKQRKRRRRSRRKNIREWETICMELYEILHSKWKRFHIFWLLTSINCKKRRNMRIEPYTIF